MVATALGEGRLDHMRRAGSHVLPMNFAGHGLVRSRRRAPLTDALQEVQQHSSERTRPALCGPVAPSTVKETAVGTDFAGKTAPITGAGRGVGRAIALGLADAGAGVVLLARTAGQLDETSDLLRAPGVPAGRISVLPADLADEHGQRLPAGRSRHRRAGLDSQPGRRARRRP